MLVTDIVLVSVQINSAASICVSNLKKNYVCLKKLSDKTGRGKGSNPTASLCVHV